MTLHHAPEPVLPLSTVDDSLAAYLRTVHPDDRQTVTLAVTSAAPGPFASAHRVVTDVGVKHVLWVGSARRDGVGTRVDGRFLDVSAEHASATRSFVEEAILASDTHRASIERAKGIIMAEHRASEVEAFTALRRRSNEANVKVRLLAELIVRERSSRGLVTIPRPARRGPS
ncbi:ANTAR domain-containing protein [Cellulomonas rhizosphaerae]|uniref:ANTAR domain-containing protein n=1 Tax=Cellulomonas rhizosphaerae TaxID=2293719 RepID=A0A413RR09_9CELL|nr:ANTAR domain-containing protein [Cellulomonas rhizosphaerae]RHA44436.1 ANTAR domain-containing protein [Cellulomonas rhizosphaerae]